MTLVILKNIDLGLKIIVIDKPFLWDINWCGIVDSSSSNLENKNQFPAIIPRNGTTKPPTMDENADVNIFECFHDNGFEFCK